MSRWVAPPPRRSTCCAARWRTGSCSDPRATPPMTEAGSSALDAAWGHLPTSREATANLGSFTRARIERVITLLVGPGSLFIGAQAVFASFGPGDERPGWSVDRKSVVLGTSVLVGVDPGVRCRL